MRIKTERLTPFGNWLENQRNRKVLSRQEWCRELGINQMAYRNMIRGDTEPFPSTVRKIFERLGFTPEAGMEAVEQFAKEQAEIVI